MKTYTSLLKNRYVTINSARRIFSRELVNRYFSFKKSSVTDDHKTAQKEIEKITRESKTAVVYFDSVKVDWLKRTPRLTPQLTKQTGSNMRQTGDDDIIDNNSLYN